MRPFALILISAFAFAMLGCEPPAAPRAPAGSKPKSKPFPGADKKGGTAQIQGMSPEDLSVLPAGMNAESRIGSALGGNK